MQPTIMSADAIVKSFNDQMHTFKGMNNLKDQQNMNAITKLQDTFKLPQVPAHSMVTSAMHSPRVVFHDRVQFRMHDPKVNTTLE